MAGITVAIFFWMYMKHRQALRMAWRLPCSRPCSLLKLSKGKARLTFQDTYTLGKIVIDKLLTAETGAKDRIKKLDFNTRFLRKPLPYLETKKGLGKLFAIVIY